MFRYCQTPESVFLAE